MLSNNGNKIINITKKSYIRGNATASNKKNNVGIKKHLYI